MRRIRLRYADGVNKRHRAIISQAVDWLRPQAEHYLPILIVPHPVIGSEKDGYGFGMFLVHDDKPSIYMGTGAYNDIRKIDGREFADRFLVHTLFHEFCHYRQFAQGKPIVECGVEQRTKGMVRRYLKGAKS